MKIVDEKYNIFEFNSSNEPALVVESGDNVMFQAQDCFCNLLKSEKMLRSNLIKSGVRINPVNGPVYVKEAEPGDTLKITVKNITISDDYGTMVLSNEDLKVMEKYITSEETLKIPIQNGYATFFNNMQLPVQPMIGVIGVAPKEGSVLSSTPGRHGGNMDCKHITKGSTLYLPVSVPGALLGVGDVHAIQGDGEVFAALEVPANVSLKIDLIKGRQEEWPILETKDKWYVITSAKTMDEANLLAVDAMADFLQKRGNEYSIREWLVMMGVLGDLEVCQIVDPLMTARFGIAKVLSAGLYF